MNYSLVKQAVDLVSEFEEFNSKKLIYPATIDGFKQWIAEHHKSKKTDSEPHWYGKENGRSAESVISTMIVHLNRFAKLYSKSAIAGSQFSNQEEFIYLITLRSFGEMTKINLIKKNIHEKPVGMQIINRLIAKNWVVQTDSEIDKRNKMINISTAGIEALDAQMDDIRKASRIVTGDLSHEEKMQLIDILSKLNDFHQPIYEKNIASEDLLEFALNQKNN